MQGEFIKGFLIKAGDGLDNSLPGREHPVDPGYGVPELGGPVDPGYGVPLPPVVTHPIQPTPGHPIVIPPTYPTNELPGHPDNSLPVGPSHLPYPPITTWPPPQPVFPGLPIYPDNALPIPPGAVWPPVPGIKGKVLCFVWIVGVGYRWTVIDPSLHVDIGLPGDQPGIDNTLPGSRNRPSNELPQTPQPKR